MSFERGLDGAPDGFFAAGQFPEACEDAVGSPPAQKQFTVSAHDCEGPNDGVGLASFPWHPISLAMAVSLCRAKYFDRAFGTARIFWRAENAAQFH